MIQKSVFKTAAEKGAKKLIEYFDADPDSRDTEAATIGVKAGSNFARMYAAETNRLAVTLAYAKAADMGAETLRDTVQQLTGLELLPVDGERSGGDAGAVPASS